MLRQLMTGAKRKNAIIGQASIIVGFLITLVGGILILTIFMGETAKINAETIAELNSTDFNLTSEANALAGINNLTFNRTSTVIRIVFVAAVITILLLAFGGFVFSGRR